MPNRRRRRLSTATSAVAALAVASPFAYIAVCSLAADTKPAPQHHEFVRAASMTDLPGELMGALTQGLSQFGVNLPPVPSLTGAHQPRQHWALPGLRHAPDLTSPGLTSPGLTSPGLTSPGLTSPGLTTPGSDQSGPDTRADSDPRAGHRPTPGLTPGLTDSVAGHPRPDQSGSDLARADQPDRLRSAPAPAAANPSEFPISDPIGLDPGAGGTYPILGDPSLGAASGSSSGGLVSDMMSAANQLGAGQAIDLLKGMIMPGLQNAAHGAAAPVPPPPVAPIP